VQIKFVAFWNNLYIDMLGQGIREAYQGLILISVFNSPKLSLEVST